MTKGASILRMLHAYLGGARLPSESLDVGDDMPVPDDPFMESLYSYVNQHQLANVITADLWKSVSASTGADIMQHAIKHKPNQSGLFFSQSSREFAWMWRA